MTISNNATFRSAGTVDNTIGTVLNVPGPAGSATIGAAAATTLTLTGTLSHLSQGRINFGSATDTGTVVASFASILENATHSSFGIGGGTLVMGNAANAANLFSFPGAGVTQFDGGGVLDTAGFATTISNLNFNDGTIRTGSGVLNLTVNDVFATPQPQSGTIQGTAGVDSLVVNTKFGFSLLETTFANWTPGTDTITLNGSTFNNTILGSTQREIINGFDGADFLEGGGGLDLINGGNGNDTILLSASGMQVNGGADIDTLAMDSGTLTVASVTGMERILLFNGTLALTDDQITNGFSLNTSLAGTGTVRVTFDTSPATQSILLKLMTAEAGANVTFQIIGSSGVDVIKAATGIQATISTGGGSVNIVQASDLADVVTGGSGIDKIAGNGGVDRMTGGTEADVFKFRAIADSGLGASADVITDFVHGTDKLNFLRIDTDPFTAGDQGFTFIENQPFFNNGAAQIRWVDLGADLRVEVDTNGDTVADMHVLLQGAGAQVLGAGDFVL